MLTKIHDLQVTKRRKQRERSNKVVGTKKRRKSGSVHHLNAHIGGNNKIEQQDTGETVLQGIKEGVAQERYNDQEVEGGVQELTNWGAWVWSFCRRYWPEKQGIERAFEESLLYQEPYERDPFEDEEIPLHEWMVMSALQQQAKKKKKKKKKGYHREDEDEIPHSSFSTFFFLFLSFFIPFFPTTFFLFVCLFVCFTLISLSLLRLSPVLAHLYDANVVDTEEDKLVAKLRREGNEKNRDSIGEIVYLKEQEERMEESERRKQASKESTGGERGKREAGKNTRKRKRKEEEERRGEIPPSYSFEREDFDHIEIGIALERAGAYRLAMRAFRAGVEMNPINGTLVSVLLGLLPVFTGGSERLNDRFSIHLSFIVSSLSQYM